MKANIDASFDEDNLSGTTRDIIKDNRARFVAARNFKLSTMYDVVSVEAMALKDGLLLADSIRCSPAKKKKKIQLGAID